MSPTAARPETASRRLLLLIGAGQVFAGLTLLAILVTLVYPTLPARWLFFTGVVWLVSGVSLWGLLFLHALRDPEATRAARPPALTRQALEIGAFAAFLVWLQWGRLLTLPMAFMAGLLFLALEGLWTAWQPSEDGD